MSDTLRLQLNHLLIVSDAEYAANAADNSDAARGSALSGSQATPLSGGGSSSSGRGGIGAKPAQNMHIEELATIVKSAVANDLTEDLGDMLQELETNHENEIKEICDSGDNPFLGVASQLSMVNTAATQIKKTSDLVGKQMERSSDKLIESAQRHVNMNRTRVNLEQSLYLVKLCLQALEHTNQVQRLLKSNHRVAAVQNLEDLQQMELDELRHMGMGALISRSVPALTREITRATLQSLDAYFSQQSLQEQITVIGERSFKLLENQKRDWSETVSTHSHLRAFRFNSPVELAYRRSGRIFLTESELRVDLGPLYEADMVFDKLGKSHELHSFVDEKMSLYGDSLIIKDRTQLVESFPRIAGFCLFNRIMSRHLPAVRASKMVDDAWEKLAQNISTVAGSSIGGLNDFRKDSLPLKKQLCTLMDTLHNFEFNIASINDLLQSLLTRLTNQMVSKTQADFKHRWEESDGSGEDGKSVHMPVVVETREAYEAVMRTVWYNPNDYEDAALADQVPKALPFSEIYLLTCQDLRALIEHCNSFLDQFQQDPGFVENTLSNAIDAVLKDTVCDTLSGALRGSQRELIVQTLIDLKLFHDVSIGIEKSLAKMRGATGRRGIVTLEATPTFDKAVKEAEIRVYQLLDQNIMGLFETAEFDWFAQEPQPAPSQFVLDMTSYLLTLTNSLLKRLPPDVRSMAYFNMGSSINTGLSEMLKDAPNGITQDALDNLDKDLTHIQDTFTQTVGDSSIASPSEALMEVRQIVDLLRTENLAETNPQVLMRKYDRLTLKQITELIPKVLRSSRQQSESAPGSPDASLSPRTAQSGFMRLLAGDR